MKEADDVWIAGKNSVGDWKILRKRLESGEGWNDAYSEFFYERLETRYFRPIRLIQGGSENIGEGFSIVALQCSLIEYLASTLSGESYRHVPPAGCSVEGCLNKVIAENKPTEHEYTGSSKLFRDFLRQQKPFCGYFHSNTKAVDFYNNVRCALLHEARTKNGWRIRTDTPVAIDANNKTINRNRLQCDFETYAASYGELLRLPKQDELRKAFIRKFDSLCDN